MSRLRPDLPSRPRAIYKKNPIAEVICAIRFPRVLALLQDLPAEFQRRVAGDYPLVEVREPFAAIHIANEQGGSIEKTLNRSVQFKSEDGSFVVALEPELLALTCTRYHQWEEFLPRFAQAAKHAFQCYNIPLVNRIGIRFQSILRTDAIGLEGRPWTELIRPPILASTEFFTGPITDLPAFNQTWVLEIDPGKIRIQLAAVSRDGKDGLLIDTDCFVDSETFRSLDECTDRLHRLHEYSGRIFQACIPDDVHNRLEPQPVG